ncbi:hypothetical protein SAMN05421505_110139 [Sinosporangium album]|uniref:Secreted protein n=1 Tax=Sinosporangium album TaxID=504805 RepID=A0A1G7Z0Q8_9ACTN|nr:hypothetical protein [Sinosporangium album]SDH02234.1 hypothetical protein SAMN05421505_110139 [Sinosporangium album]
MSSQLRTAVLAVPFAALLALTACGTDKPQAQIASAGNTPAADASAPAGGGEEQLKPEEKILKFVQCMRENGVQMEDPDPSDGGRFRMDMRGQDKSIVEAAQQKCQKHSPMSGPGAKQDPQMAENMVKMAQCMRANGVEKFPDPEGQGLLITPEISKDPDFPAAQKKCESPLPALAPQS